MYHLVLAVDPITLSLIGMGIGGLAGGAGVASQLFGSKPQAPSMPAPAPPVQSPTGTSASNKNIQAPSFLAAAAAPQGAQLGPSGGKTLLGQ